jgi:hypothetical protein
MRRVVQILLAPEPVGAQAAALLTLAVLAWRRSS